MDYEMIKAIRKIKGDSYLANCIQNQSELGKAIEKLITNAKEHGDIFKQLDKKSFIIDNGSTEQTVVELVEVEDLLLR